MKREDGFTPERLRSAREVAGLTQQELAFEIHTAMSTIQMWENGRRRPTGLYLERVMVFIREVEARTGAPKSPRRQKKG